MHLLKTQAVGFVQARLDFLLHGQSHLHRHGGHGFEEQLPDCCINASPRNYLTDRLTVLHVIAITKVCRGKMLTTMIVTHAHSIPTNTTDHPSLQQGRAFPGWTVTAVDSVSLAVVA